MEDNLYQNDGSIFDQPEALRLDAEEEQAKVTKAKPLIRDVLAHLDERIAFLQSIDSIPADLSIEPEVHQKLVEVNRLVRDILASEKEYITQLIKQY